MCVFSTWVSRCSTACGYSVQGTSGLQEFGCTGVNVVTHGEHVPEIKRLIHVWKEGTWYYYPMLLAADIDTIPHMMVMQLMIILNFYVNAFAWTLSVSQILLPLTIVEGIVVDFHKHFYVIFGEYIQTFEGTTNTMKLCTVGALALGPSGNLQGGIC